MFDTAEYEALTEQHLKLRCRKVTKTINSHWISFAGYTDSFGSTDYYDYSSQFGHSPHDSTA